jgi:hypothetical protein
LEKEVKEREKESDGPAEKRATEHTNARRGRAKQMVGKERMAENGIRADTRADIKEEARAKARLAKEAGQAPCRELASGAAAPPTS